MTDNENKELKIYPLEHCNWAYTYKGSQNVRCTWISDSPLEDPVDYLLDDGELSMEDPILQQLERDIAGIKESQNEYEKCVTRVCGEPTSTKLLFREDAFELIDGRPTLSNLGEALETLRESDFAAGLLNHALTLGVEIRDTNETTGADYCEATKTLSVRRDLNKIDKVLLLARELRKIYVGQVNPLELNPDFAIVVERARVADEATAMVRTAWDLVWKGHTEVWTRLHNSPMSDLGRCFGREALKDFRAVKDGRASRATFETWFLSERCRRVDRNLINHMLADYSAYVFASELEEKDRQTTVAVLKSFGKVPFGTNYLEGFVGDIINDPVFTEVRDRSNANFLWFIKFERSFSEMETVAKEPEVKMGRVIEFPVKRDK